MIELEEPRVITVDGKRVRVFERTPPLPPTLSLLLEGGRDAKGRVWLALRVVRQRPLGKLGGARAECMADNHELKPWVDGFHVGSDLVTRALHLNVCADCGSVCVRDASYDVLDGLPTGGRPLRRKDHVIGWYSGARPNQREYR